MEFAPFRRSRHAILNHVTVYVLTTSASFKRFQIQLVILNHAAKANGVKKPRVRVSLKELAHLFHADLGTVALMGSVRREPQNALHALSVPLVTPLLVVASLLAPVIVVMLPSTASVEHRGARATVSSRGPEFALPPVSTGNVATP